MAAVAEEGEQEQEGRRWTGEVEAEDALAEERVRELWPGASGVRYRTTATNTMGVVRAKRYAVPLGTPSSMRTTYTGGYERYAHLMG